MRPDIDADRRLYTAMIDGDYSAWTAMSSQEIIDAGQHEVLNWVCLLGAVIELGLQLQWSELVEIEMFNSNRSFAVFR